MANDQPTSGDLAKAAPAVGTTTNPRTARWRFVVSISMKQTGILLAGTATCVLVLDQWSKAEFRHEPDRTRIRDGSVVDLWHVEHRSDDAAGHIALAASMILPTVGVALYKRNAMAAIGAGLLTGGLVSNKGELAVRGSVTDWLSFNHGERVTVINGADLAIDAGVVASVTALMIPRR